MRGFARFFCVMAAVGGWAAACNTSSVSGGDGESHFLTCREDDDCTKLGIGFTCLGGHCRRSRGNAATVTALRDAATATPLGDGSPERESAADGSQPRDAAAEAVDAPTTADVSDALLAPDCTCPPDDYYVDIDNNGNGVPEHLTFPYRLSLYCDETEPQLAHPPCGTVYRLSACAGPQNTPPCIYLAVDGSAPQIGIFQDVTGQSFVLVTGQIGIFTASGASPTLVAGTFSATYTSTTSEASIKVTGTYRACAVTFPSCKR